MIGTRSYLYATSPVITVVVRQFSTTRCIARRDTQATDARIVNRKHTAVATTRANGVQSKKASILSRRVKHGKRGCSNDAFVALSSLTIVVMFIVRLSSFGMSTLIEYVVTYVSSLSSSSSPLSSSSIASDLFTFCLSSRPNGDTCVRACVLKRTNDTRCHHHQRNDFIFKHAHARQTTVIELLNSRAPPSPCAPPEGGGSARLRALTGVTGFCNVRKPASARHRVTSSACRQCKTDRFWTALR